MIRTFHRITVIVTAAIAALFLTVPAHAASAAIASNAATVQDETKAFEMVNEIRKANGLTQLRYDGELDLSADTRAHEIVQNFSHIRPDGSQWYTVDETHIYGENLAEGTAGYTPEMVVEAWMESNEHRDNILNGQFTSCAIAEVRVNNKTYWVQEFGIT